jgi:hypothetical protein
MNDSILIIGPPNSGKTTFIAQFLTRVKKRKNSISLLKMPENIEAITDAVKQLAKGESPTPTSAGNHVKLILPIKVNDKDIQLVCPDYGGEQVNNITEFMEIDEHWTKLLGSSDRWILFIRPHSITCEYDLSKSSYEEVSAEKSVDTSSPALSEQSRFIELLQSLLYAKNIGVKELIGTPSLCIVLTCWDELDGNETPIEVLQSKLPLLLHFIETVWHREAFRVLGLSSQEFSLDTPEAKDKYQDELPENFGYMIDQGGNIDNDITNLIKICLEI